MQSVFERYIESNERLYRRPRPTSGLLYVDCAAADPVLLNGVLRIAAAFADIRRLRLAAAATRWGFGKERSVLKSFGVCEILPTYFAAICGAVIHPLKVLSVAALCATGGKVRALTYKKSNVGIHIYDFLLRRHRQPYLERLTIRLRIEVAFEVAYFLYLQRWFHRFRPDCVVLSDNVYRQGMIFEIAKEMRIQTVCGISLDDFAAHIYYSDSDYTAHCRSPDDVIVSSAVNKSNWAEEGAEILDIRTRGAENQHDTSRAYGLGARVIEFANLCQRYNLPAGCKVVLVMAHVFQDAPHAYPNTLFDDYREWLVDTCRALVRNRNVSVMVKEHPSVSLYGEEGVLERVLAEADLKCVPVVRGISTKTFLGQVAAIVTCGGTCGLEFPCYGTPVIVGARPPYSGASYIIRPKDKSAYLAQLAAIHEIGQLSAVQRQEALAMFYVFRVLMIQDKIKFGFGTQGHNLVSCSQPEKLWSEMIQVNQSDACYTELKSYIAWLLTNHLENFVRHDIWAS